MSDKPKPRAKKSKRPGMTKVTPVFKAPANPTTWKPTPRQMELYFEICHGKPPWVLAQELRTSTDILQAMCDHIDEYFVEKSIRDIRMMRVRMQFKLEALYQEAMQSFRLSKNPGVSKEVSVGKSGEGVTEKMRTTSHDAGQSAFLSIAKDILSDLRDLWAMNKKTVDEVQDEGFRIAGRPHVQALEMEFERMKIRLLQAKGETIEG